MHFYKRLLLLSFTLSLSLTPSLAYAKESPCEVPSEISSELPSEISLFDFGPGVDNLSAGNQYSQYQWGLKNKGEYQLLESVRKFRTLDSTYQRNNKSRYSSGLLLPVGPSDYENLITYAQPDIDINMKPAWELYDKKEEKRQVIVGVIDTGIDSSHVDLQSSMWVNEDEIPGDGIDNDINGYIDDINGWNFFYKTNEIFNGSEDSHGTHAAGTIAASRHTGGITGIADNQYVKLMSLKALGSEAGIGEPASVVAAIRYAEANGASICNLSFGTYTYTEELSQVIRDSKMLFVVASGNGDWRGIGFNTDERPIYPAALPHDNVISVANLMFDGTLGSSSNFGTASVDIAAPGTYILSTTPGNTFAFMSGTSMAAPMVTGVAALLYSYEPSLSLTDVKNVLLNSSRKLDSLNTKILTGGMVDAYAALNSVSN